MYEEINDILEGLPQGEYGSWIIDYENDASTEHPIQMPYVSYSGIAEKLMDAVYTFDKSHPEYGLNRYGDILEWNGIKWGSDSMYAVDVADKDGICVMAMLIGCCGLRTLAVHDKCMSFILTDRAKEKKQDICQKISCLAMYRWVAGYLVFDGLSV